MQAVTKFHMDIFNCNYRNLPMSVFADFHNRRSTQNFISCGLRHQLISVCQSILADICVSREGIFGRTTQGKNLEMSVTNNCFEKVKYSIEQYNQDMSSQIGDEFYEYTACLETIRHRFIKNCEQRSVKRCKDSKIQVAKEIRLSMEFVEEIMDKIPDLHFIYYVRDPRAIVSSRISLNKLDAKSFRVIGGLISFHTFEEEADVLCERIRYDLKILKHLKKKYPTRILELKFEKLASQPIETATNVYNFISEQIPEDVLQWIKGATSGGDNKRHNFYYKFGTNRDNSTLMINAWRIQLIPKEIQIINEYCDDVISELNYAL